MLEQFNINSESSSEILNLVIAHGLKAVAAIVILILGWTAARWLSKIALKAMRKAKLDETLARFLSSLVRYAVLAFTIIAVMAQFGIQTTSLVALLGAVGLAIGLSLQGTLSHVASGVMLLIFRPFSIGDYIQAGGEAGTVSEIGLFNTILNTPQNVKVIVPNSRIWDASIHNFSAHKTRRLDITVGIAYEDSIDAAMKVLNSLISKEKRIQKDPEPAVIVTGLGDSSVNIQMRLWVKGSDYWPVNFDMTKAVKDTFDKEGISIPYPQRTVHMVPTVEETATKSKKKAA